MKIYKIYDTDGNAYYTNDPYTILDQFGTVDLVEEYETSYIREVTDIINGELFHEL